MRIVLNRFSGERPKLAPHLLAESEAQIARNCRLEKGDVRSFKKPEKDEALGLTTNETIFRSEESGNFHWCESANDLDFAPSPIAGEQYERVYYTGESEPRVLANDVVSVPFDFTTDFYKLGLPPPAAAPTVGSSGGGSIYKGYVYTYVTRYGEEGPPSDVGLITDYSTGNITIDTLSAVVADRAITSLRFYRTNSSGAGVAEFQFVCEATWFSDSVAYAVGDFVIYTNELYKCTTIHPAASWNAGHFTAGDDVTDANLGEVLPSENWDAPPDGLAGLIALPSGVFAGFYENKVYLTEPYLPHAWPYSYSFEYDIVGLGFFGTNIVVITTGNPSLLYGTDPASMGKYRYGDFYPGTAKRSIVMGKDGVFFSSTEGLIRVDQSGIAVVTENLMNKEDWEALDTDTIHGVFYQGKYLGFNDGVEGFVIDFTNRTYSVLTTYAHSTHVAKDGFLYIVEDDFSVIDEGDPPVNMPLCVSKWEGDTVNYLLFTWRSRRYILPKISFSAARVVLDGSFYSGVEDNAGLASLNTALFADELEGDFGGSALNRHPVNGDTLYDMTSFTSGDSIMFRLYVDESLKFSKTLSDEDNVFRLAGGFKGRKYEVEIEGYPPVRQVVLSPSIEELDQ